MANYTTPQTISAPGSNYTDGEGASTAGAVALTYYDSSSNPHAAIDQNGTITPLDPGATSSNANAISASGIVAGYFYDGTHYDAATFSGGTTSQINLGSTATNSFAYGISQNGSSVVGQFDTSGGDNHSFVSTNGATTVIDVPGITNATYANAVNDSGEVVGTFYPSGGGSGAFIYDSTSKAYTEFEYPNAPYTYADDVNNSGTIVGQYYNGTNTSSFTRNQNGTLTAINVAAAVSGVTDTYANSINDAGQVAGSYYDSAGNEHGFEYFNGTYNTIDVAGATDGTSIQSINDAGEVTGTAYTSTGSVAFTSLPLPEIALTSTAPASGPDNAPYTITGDVLSAGQVPLANQTVTISDNGTAVATTTTNASGDFTVAATLPVTGANSVVASVTDAQGVTASTAAVTYNLFKAVHDLDATSQIVDELFYTLLDRAATATEVSTYDTKLDHHLTPKKLATDLLTSHEYRSKNGHPTNSQFVQALFENATGSAPDATTLSTDIAHLHHGQSRAALAASVATSSAAVSHIGGLAIG